MTFPLEPFILSESEKLHPLGLRFKAYFTERLDALRQRNDVSQPEQDTAILRGEIRCLKQLITLWDDRPVTGDLDTP